jgi:TRAP-type mannitol/chloroaromatic compound transport system permease small subunit
MDFWLSISRILDRLSERVGLAVGWLTLLMVLIGAYNAVVRYLGKFFGWNLASNAYIEAQWYLFSLVFLLGAAYTLRRGAHVRVDVLYGRLDARGRAWINLLGTIVFLLPFSLFALWVSWPAVHNSWVIREVSPDPGGLPRYPIKAMILVGFTLLILQGISEIVKQVAILRGRTSEDDSAHEPQDDMAGMA